MLTDELLEPVFGGVGLAQPLVQPRARSLLGPAVDRQGGLEPGYVLTRVGSAEVGKRGALSFRRGGVDVRR